MQRAHSMSLPLYCPDCVGSLFGPCSMSTPCHSLRIAQIVWVAYSVHAACPLHVNPSLMTLQARKPLREASLAAAEEARKRAAVSFGLCVCVLK